MSDAVERMVRKADKARMAVRDRYRMIAREVAKDCAKIAREWGDAADAAAKSLGEEAERFQAAFSDEFHAIARAIEERYGLTEASDEHGAAPAPRDRRTR